MHVLRLDGSYCWDFPSGPVVNPPANAGDMGSIPVQEDTTCDGAIKPNAPQLLSLCSATAEARAPRACAA